MHQRILSEFQQLLSEIPFSGEVLEIGAVPSDESLLALPALEQATGKVGINLDGPYRHRDFDILQGNANAMPELEDDRFGLVVTNSHLEHDRGFWKTLDEIRRVTRPGGWVVIGTPGYRNLGFEDFTARLRRMPLLWRLARRPPLESLCEATLTFRVHAQPEDYWRFTPQAHEEVLLEGMEAVSVRSVMVPPRIISQGRLPAT